MDLAGERFQLRPDLLLADHLPQLVVAGVAGGEPGHAHQELQEAALRVGAAVGVLPDLDQAGALLVHDDRGQEDEEIGGVDGGRAVALGLAQAAMRRQHTGLGAGDRLAEQLVVAFAPFLGPVQADLAHVNLILELEVALLGQQPHRAGRGGEGLQDALEELAVVIVRGQVGLGQVGDLFRQSVDLSPGLLDEVDIILVGHGRPRAWEGNTDATAALLGKIEW